MFALKLTLWIITYTVGIARISLALFLMVRERKKEDIWKLAFLFVFVGLIISLSNFESLGRLGQKNCDAFGIAAIYFSLFLTYTLPMHIQTSFPVNHKKAKFIFLTAYTGLLFTALTVSSLFKGFLLWNTLFIIVISSMVVAIIYSMVMVSKHTKKRPQLSDRILSLLVIPIIPVMIWVDFIRQYGESYIILPLMYIMINVLMMKTELAEFLVLQKKPSVSASRMDSFRLTKREQEVARLLMQGRTYQQIADGLFISLQTVKTHVSRIYAKTDSQNKMELLKNLSG